MLSAKHLDASFELLCILIGPKVCKQCRDKPCKVKYTCYDTVGDDVRVVGILSQLEAKSTVDHAKDENKSAEPNVCEGPNGMFSGALENAVVDEAEYWL